MTEQDIINKYLGVPYKHQGRDMAGLDCYGLIIAIYADLGIKLFDIEEDYSIDWSWKGKNLFIENAYKEWQGVVIPTLFDVVGFKNGKGIFNHAGVMLDKVRFINACKAGVIVSRIDLEIWQKRLNGFYRYKGLND